MRPAQKAPENPNSLHRYECFDSRPHFNEAGAKSAGKPLQERQPATEGWRHASMRPAQKAPENQQALQGPSA